MILLLVISMAGLTQNPKIQVTENEVPERLIEINIHRASSESGYGSSLNFNIGIEKDNRRMAAGAVYQNTSGKISGGEISYRHHLHPPDITRMRPYLQYNFLFRYNTFSSQSFHAINPDMPGEVGGGRVATFEHYLGAGTQIRLFQKFFLDLAVGYGTILGSADEKFRETEHYTMGGRRQDFGLMTKFGISYQIGNREN